jgi:hypothetical protein
MSETSGSVDDLEADVELQLMPSPEMESVLPLLNPLGVRIKDGVSAGLAPRLQLFTKLLKLSYRATGSSTVQIYNDRSQTWEIVGRGEIGSKGVPWRLIVIFLQARSSQIQLFIGEERFPSWLEDESFDSEVQSVFLQQPIESFRRVRTPEQALRCLQPTVCRDHTQELGGPVRRFALCHPVYIQHGFCELTFNRLCHC